MNIHNAPRLTSLAHGGGCGCKIAPSVLQTLLGALPVAQAMPNLLVGTETGDDAAVWKINDNLCLIATTDFFMPMVDDPRDFGRIAAANAISDVYAMGGKPILALAILGMPVGKLAPEVVSQILAGGASICAEAGIPVAGGHSIDNPEPIYGLAVIGTCPPGNVRRNTGARPGDVLILTKGLGIGVYSAAFKQGALPAAAYDEMIASTTKLNTVGARLGEIEDVHAMTDVTGFGLLGHALEMARGSAQSLELNWGDVPLLTKASGLAAQGFITGASKRNWDSYGASVVNTAGLPEQKLHILTDPQTSGGLLIACAPETAQAVLEEIVSEGYPLARIVGRVASGSPLVNVLT